MTQAPRRNRGLVPGMATVATISEAAFELQVIGDRKRPGFAPLLGYCLAYHTHDSRRSPFGFPDWVLVRDEPQARVLFLELKGTTGQPSAEQQEWIECLLAAGAEARCYWPEQMEELRAWLK